MNASVTAIQILSSDYSKIAYLCADRNIELHAQYGKHFKIRIPKFGRDLLFEKYSAELWCGGVGPQLWRLNLEEGRFAEPVDLGCRGVNVLDFSSALNLLAVGTEEGNTQFWDIRGGVMATQIPIPHHPAFNTYPYITYIYIYIYSGNCEITAISWQPDSVNVCIGSSVGDTISYDIRYPLPLFRLKHQYETPIRKIAYKPLTQFSPSKLIVSDSKIIKIYDMNRDEEPKLWTYIEPPSDINDLALIGNSGLLMVALEEEKMGVYYFPELGNAPLWCSFLENLTEEMEEGWQGGMGEVKDAIYDDYKFITKNELEE